MHDGSGTEPKSDLRQWLTSRHAFTRLTDDDYGRVVAWLQSGTDADLEGGPDEPFRRGGTPRREFHARLVAYVSNASDGREGWRPPTQRLQSHFFGERHGSRQDRHWSRGYDDPLVRSPGGHHFGELASGGPLDYNDDRYDAFKEHVIAVHARSAVDADGFSVSVDDDDGYPIAFDVFDPWDFWTRIPERPRLWELDADGYRQHLMRGSEIWGFVDSLLDVGVSEYAAWALCAYSRPDLVPMPDRVVAELLGLRADEDAKPYWWWALHTDPDLLRHLEELRDGSEVRYLSLLRSAEIVVLVRESDRRNHVGLMSDLSF